MISKLTTFLLLLAAFLTAAKLPPVKPKKLKITDGELLKYGIFVGGERYQDIQIVSKLSKDGKKIHVYTGKYTIGSKFKMPTHYTNYQRQFVVDLAKCTLIGGFGDYYQEFVLDRRTGEAAFSIDIDYKKNMAVYVGKIWDGYEIRKKTTRVKIIPGYAVWDIPSVAFVASRFLDLDDQGVIYGVYPTVVKEAVPVTVRKINKESVTTKAGTFNTVKIGIGITDPFLARLLETYIREMHIWVEDTPRGLIIQTQSPEEVYKLEGISVWQE